MSARAPLLPLYERLSVLITRSLPARSLTEFAPDTWRSVFWVSAGIGALIGLLALWVVPKDRPKDHNLKVDWIGGALITSAVTLLTFSLAGGEGAPDGVCFVFFRLSRRKKSVAELSSTTASGKLHTSPPCSPSRSCASSPSGSTNATSNGTRLSPRS